MSFKQHLKHSRSELSQIKSWVKPMHVLQANILKSLDVSQVKSSKKINISQRLWSMNSWQQKMEMMMMMMMMMKRIFRSKKKMKILIVGFTLRFLV